MGNWNIYRIIAFFIIVKINKPYLIFLFIFEWSSAVTGYETAV